MKHMNKIKLMKVMKQRLGVNVARRGEDRKSLYFAFSILASAGSRQNFPRYSDEDEDTMDPSIRHILESFRASGLTDEDYNPFETPRRPIFRERRSLSSHQTNTPDTSDVASRPSRSRNSSRRSPAAQPPHPILVGPSLIRKII
jgi:hypothetical protein